MTAADVLHDVPLREAIQALDSVFDAQASNLPTDRALLLVQDVAELAAEEMDSSGSSYWMLMNAGAVLRQRIGGIQNLGSYTDSLAAGAAARK